MTYRITLDRKDHGTMTSSETWPTKEEANAALIRILAADFRTHGGTYPKGGNLVGGLTLPATDPMREPQAPVRGSGPATCCGFHRERCLFGRQHGWSAPWCVDGRMQRTRATFPLLGLRRHLHRRRGLRERDSSEGRGAMSARAWRGRRTGQWSAELKAAKRAARSRRPSHLWPCGCLKNDAGAHRVGCPDHPEGVRGR
jgi:hypothetical protein